VCFLVAKGTLKGFFRGFRASCLLFTDEVTKTHKTKNSDKTADASSEKRIQKVLKDSKGNFFKSFLLATRSRKAFSKKI